MEEENKDGKEELEEKRSSKLLRIIGVINLIILVAVLSIGYSVTKVEEPKVSFLDGREYNKQEMETLIEGYYTTVSERDWERRKETTRFSPEVINQIYGESYENFNKAGITGYKFIDVQYTITDTSNYKMYLSTIVEKDEKRHLRVFLASVEQDEIVHIEVY